MGRRRTEATSSAAHPASVLVGSLAHNPRNARDDYEDVDELAASIEEYGVLQPLGVVRYEIFLARYPEHEDAIGSAHWVVIQGNRRLAAARRAQLDEVPVVVQEQLGRGDQFDESILIENVHREGLPILREAALLRELLNKHGSQRSLASKIKKSQGYISQRLSLLDLAPILQEELSRGELSVMAARELASLPHDEQVEAYKAGPPYKEAARESSTTAVGSGSADYGVISHAANAPENPPPEASTAGQSDDDADYDVISTESSEGARPKRRSKFPEPAVLASRLRQEYTAEQREELASLLMN